MILFSLFLFYSGIQYIVTNVWVNNLEEKNIRKLAVEIVGYMDDQAYSLSPSQLQKTTSFLERLNEENQLIRILDHTGQPLITLSQNVPANWVAPRTVVTQTFELIRYGEDKLLVIRCPFGSSPFQGTIEIVRNLESFDSLNNLLLLTMLFAGSGSIVLSAAGGFLIARQVIKPVQSLAETMNIVRKTGHTHRVEFTDNGDELSQLATIFNEMMNRLELSFKQQNQFVEDASHELRTPLAVIEGHLSLLQRWGKNDPKILDESINAALTESRRLKALVKELLELSRTDGDFGAKQVARIYPGSVISHTIQNFMLLYPEYTFDVEIESIRNVQININPNHLEQVLSIVIDNAIKYSCDNKVVEIKGKLTESEVLIIISDYGEGIPAAEISHVFDRFYRVDKARSRLRVGTVWVYRSQND
ncbi:HAMP domain-containing protein [Brevibacillus choshinensis]|uniref:Signal transduction histidine-protein kinase ArlS n=1 Tax=Brevibacillus choshinensis TaxID=54911 RepID=A0ABX7FIH1_BRECH|nr:HAMP domain-containing histidine kinase [Brevibacillus choshinensis]QRG65573.1 HAMP domain-containing protein [Brevibacillus choshinensis]